MQGWESEWGGVGAIPLIENKNKLSLFEFFRLRIPNYDFMFFEDVDAMFNIFKI